MPSESEVRLVEREIKLHGELDHPQIIRLWDTLIDGDRIYMIMEYADGGNLFCHQNAKNTFSEPEAFKFFTQTLAGVRYLHESNIIHRDLKVIEVPYSRRTCFWMRTTT
jgi:serine/threonine protein kinase